MMVAVEVDKLARSASEKVIEGYTIAPEVVAHEILRLLEMTRKMLGVSSPETADDHLFHTCGEGEHSTIVANPGHPLATAFSFAYLTDRDDPAASKIKNSYRELVSAYRSWSHGHPTASAKDQLDQVRKLTEQFRLVEQVRDYRAVVGTSPEGAKQ